MSTSVTRCVERARQSTSVLVRVHEHTMLPRGQGNADQPTCARTPKTPTQRTGLLYKKIVASEIVPCTLPLRGQGWARAVTQVPVPTAALRSGSLFATEAATECNSPQCKVQEKK